MSPILEQLKRNIDLCKDIKRKPSIIHGESSKIIELEKIGEQLYSKIARDDKRKTG